MFLAEPLLASAEASTPALLTDAGRDYLEAFETGADPAEIEAEVGALLQRLLEQAAETETIDAEMLRVALRALRSDTLLTNTFLGRRSSPPDVTTHRSHPITINLDSAEYESPGWDEDDSGSYDERSMTYGGEEAAYEEAAYEDADFEDATTMHAADGGSGSEPDWTTGAASDPETSEPPRKAWPRVDAPKTATENTAFALVVGLRPDPDPDLVGDPVERPPDQRGPYFLTVQLVADGFTLADGEHWRRDLPVTADASYPTTTYHLTPEPSAEPIRAEQLVVYYAIGGQTVGRAVRAVAVIQSDALRDQAPALPAPPGLHIAKPSQPEPVDLEVRIEYSEHRHRLNWTFESRHPLDLPDTLPPTDIGTNPDAFAKDLIRSIESLKDVAGFRLRLQGLGKGIRAELPPTFWRLLTAADEAARTERSAPRPAVLILSQEPHIPWELARCTEPFDPASPPYLCFQANVGRWVFDPDQPRIDPPRARGVMHVAAITGTYDHPKWSDLHEAKAEAQALTDAYGAIPVSADFLSVVKLCGDGDPPSDVLHFAVHGKYAPDQPGQGLVLVDGPDVRYLNDIDVRGFTLDGHPFVFLNACQVGSANERLGNYAGLAQAFLAAGATAVIAPLWSVNDRVARELALEFYQAVADGASAAEALRQARLQRIAATAEEASAAVAATPYAYQFFGHPELALGWNALPLD